MSSKTGKALLNSRLEEYSLKRSKRWELQEQLLEEEGKNKDEIELERLCFFADTFYEGCRMIERFGEESDEESDLDSKEEEVDDSSDLYVLTI